MSGLTPGALEGVRVLDLSRVLAGPWCSQLLADLGADVIKIERPEGGDDTRSWGPPWLKDEHGAPTSESAYFAAANRNKRSVAVDLAAARGQALVRQLAGKADVLIENFKTGGLQQYGLDHASLSSLYPSLIYCSITGFGQTGPYATRPGYDFLIQGMGGLMSITGRPDGEAGAGPMKVGVALTDVMTGLYAAVAILAALQRRHASGRGQHIDLALLDVQIAALANQASNYLIGGEVPRRVGNAHPNIVPYQDFPTADGHMIIAVGNDAQFRALCGALGHAEWADDERYATNPQRVRNSDALVAEIRAITSRRSTDDWVTCLGTAGVPCGPINTLDRVFDDPQVRSRGLRVELEHPLAGHVALVANPIRLSETPVTYRGAPPRLGEHTQAAVRDWLGAEGGLGGMRDGR
ncbi:MAG TPA: CaiB/BaiF CoA-transferase family protein [Burkholderiaceae bacterium]|nr:CaiB/BaiF CoA-transferase family protein [Burkholderiaceae bacterium]